MGAASASACTAARGACQRPPRGQSAEVEAVAAPRCMPVTQRDCASQPAGHRSRRLVRHVRSSASPTTTPTQCSSSPPSPSRPTASRRAARHPRRLARRGATPRGTKLELTFAVKQQNMDALEARLLCAGRVGRYGRHMTNEAVHALTAPLAAHSEMVRIFAGRFSATATPATPNGAYDRDGRRRDGGADARREVLPRLSTPSSGEVVHRAPPGYTLPVEVASAVGFVSPTTHVPGVRSLPTTPPEQPQPQRAEEFAPALLDRRGHGGQGAGQ